MVLSKHSSGTGERRVLARKWLSHLKLLLPTHILIVLGLLKQFSLFVGLQRCLHLVVYAICFVSRASFARRPKSLLSNGIASLLDVVGGVRWIGVILFNRKDTSLVKPTVFGFLTRTQLSMSLLLVCRKLRTWKCAEAIYMVPSILACCLVFKLIIVGLDCLKMRGGRVRLTVTDVVGRHLAGTNEFSPCALQVPVSPHLRVMHLLLRTILFATSLFCNHASWEIVSTIKSGHHMRSVFPWHRRVDLLVVSTFR